MVERRVFHELFNVDRVHILVLQEGIYYWFGVISSIANSIQMIGMNVIHSLSQLL